MELKHLYIITHNSINDIQRNVCFFSAAAAQRADAVGLRDAHVIDSNSITIYININHLAV